MRFISNRSTGYLGYKIAEEASKRNHHVTLISGPTRLNPPKVERFISIETVDVLYKAIKKELKGADCLIMCAAVSDFRVKRVHDKKIKRIKRLSIQLIPNKDLLAELYKYKGDKLFIGFSLETETVIRNACIKLRKKKLDIIAANRLTKRHNPFDNNKLDVSIIDRFGKITQIRGKKKEVIARVLLDKIEKLWYSKMSR